MYKFGPIIKEIRLAKGLKSKDVYHNLVTRATAVRFEKGSSDTTMEKFFVIINRLNITLEEFDFIAREKESIDKLFINQLYQAFYTNNEEKIEQLKDSLLAEYTHQSNVKYLHYHIVSQLLLDELRGMTTSTKYVNKLRDYLLKCDVWGYYEIMLFTNTIIFYHEELIDALYKEAKKTLLLYSDMRMYKNEMAILLMNIIEAKIQKGSIASASYYLGELESIRLHTLDNMYIQSMTKYFGELLTIIKSEHIDLKNIKYIIDFLDFLGLDKKKQQCEELLNKVLAEKV